MPAPHTSEGEMSDELIQASADCHADLRAYWLSVVKNLNSQTAVLIQIVTKAGCSQEQIVIAEAEIRNADQTFVQAGVSWHTFMLSIWTEQGMPPAELHERHADHTDICTQELRQYALNKKHRIQHLALTA